MYSIKQECKSGRQQMKQVSISTKQGRTYLLMKGGEYNSNLISGAGNSNRCSADKTDLVFLDVCSDKYVIAHQRTLKFPPPFV
jgi:hypothetical protein